MPDLCNILSKQESEATTDAKTFDKDSVGWSKQKDRLQPLGETLKYIVFLSLDMNVSVLEKPAK